MKAAVKTREDILALNLECLDAWEKLSQEEREEIDYDEFHADYLAARNVVVKTTAHWVLPGQDGTGVCSHCNRQDRIDPLATHCRYCGAMMYKPV